MAGCCKHTRKESKNLLRKECSVLFAAAAAAAAGRDEDYL
jgi:hypothetical protein